LCGRINENKFALEAARSSRGVGVSRLSGGAGGCLAASVSLSIGNLVTVLRQSAAFRTWPCLTLPTLWPHPIRLIVHDQSCVASDEVGRIAMMNRFAVAVLFLGLALLGTACGGSTPTAASSVSSVTISGTAPEVGAATRRRISAVLCLRRIPQPVDSGVSAGHGLDTTGFAR
jgi:hypothetical protein